MCVFLFLFTPRNSAFSGDQVGGRLTALEEHIDALKSNPLFEGTDFKLASCSEPLSDQVAKECGFTSLSIRIVKVFPNLICLINLSENEDQS